MAWRSDDLLASTRAGLLLPDANDLLTSADMLDMADEETSRVLVPWLRKKRGENYFARSADQTLVAGTTAYRMPWRAQGMALRDVCLRDAAGREISLPEVSLEERGAYELGASQYWPNGLAFCIEGDNVVILPTTRPASWTTLRIRYARRPSRLVLAASAMVITGISGGVYSGTPVAGWGTGGSYDIVKYRPGFDTLAIDQTATAVGGSSITFASNPSSEAVAYDYVTLAGETPVVQLPVELHPILCGLLRARVLEAQGQVQVAQYVRELAQRDLDAMNSLFSPRVDGEDRRTINRNSPLRVGRGR